jgi:UPF0176 protein
MAVLHNKIDSRILKQQALEEGVARTTISFYKYFKIENPQEFRDYLYKHLFPMKVFGRIYVAKEGINAQISVIDVEAFKNFLYSINELYNLRLNISAADVLKENNTEIANSFWVLKIKVREKIVADGLVNDDYLFNQIGKYVNAVEMNNMLTNKDTIVIDMRNHYEYEVGHFKNAIELPSDTFREQLPMAVNMMKGNEDKNIIMYCTGGIRCEKASAYMLHNGFKNVYHLEGGIINYAKELKENNLESAFIGKNFVFDNRLGERITSDVIAKCHQCGTACDVHVNCANSGCHLLFIQCKNCADKYNNCCSNDCKNFIALPEEEQKELRKGIDKGRNIFNKSRERKITNQ